MGEKTVVPKKPGKTWNFKLSDHYLDTLKLFQPIDGNSISKHCVPSYIFLK